MYKITLFDESKCKATDNLDTPASSASSFEEPDFLKKGRISFSKIVSEHMSVVGIFEFV